ncbi:hypothetical protein VB319_19900 [Vibrio parahaemolyticus]|uniref:Uncharacterized protein n=1 Tax=Vibrio metschnikovii TaxID=28172 RepID=A0A9X0RB69_VIBME|nr:MULTISPECIES: hypothetical protein [Vibrio]ARN69524.1 hypothetical protein FORC36_5007 [Vibrio vulnificus]EGR3228711.1 hypothetical protein [Vibrio parahaemolyticus]EGR5855848.1 hypothetical protein [Vibrio parahaemolyticus]EGR5926975.1 hypothetical protein [Vibrio parahaemolyticus]EJG0181121.1 hypothetical protein [Vibrio parahaemolyticus]
MKQEMSVFELCRKNTKMSTRELFAWLGLVVDRDYERVDLGDRYLRVIGDGNVVEFSEPKGCFDRWANSGELTLDLTIKPQRRRFINIIEAETLH